MKKSFLLLLVVLPFLNYAQNENIQPDSIEYCWLQQIYDFKLVDNQYFFSEFQTGNPIESDSLIFDPTKYFDNFTSKLDYTDSVRFAIISRTLRLYGETALYNESKKFIRINWLRPDKPILITLMPKDDSVILVYKEGNGDLDIHGIVTVQQTISMDISILNKSYEFLNKADFFNLTHGIWFCHQEDSLLDLADLFVEAYDGANYNIVIVDECNFDYANYKYIKKLLDYLLKKIE